MTIKQKFLKATNDWYNFVSQDHHKDHDCHWYIGQIYSYGFDTGKYKYEKNNWYVEHTGYVTEFGATGRTKNEVMKKATEFINDRIKNNL